jgi:hypothetical protein
VVGHMCQDIGQLRVLMGDSVTNGMVRRDMSGPGGPKILCSIDHELDG